MTKANSFTDYKNSYNYKKLSVKIVRLAFNFFFAVCTNNIISTSLNK